MQERGEEEEVPGLWTSFGAALRLIVGWFCVAIGILNLLVEADRTTVDPDTAYIVFHVMLVVGGLVLLGVTWLGHRPGALGHTAGAVVAAGGFLAGSVPAYPARCCMTAFDIRHGYPFTLAARDDVAGAAGRWHIDSQHLLADLLFWGYVGLIALVLVALARRLVGGDEDQPDGDVAADRPVTNLSG